MPETSLYENYFLVPGQDNVWLPWQITAMQTKPKTKTVKYRPYNKFRLSILAANARHQSRALWL